jgi:hypothetical protein
MRRSKSEIPDRNPMPDDEHDSTTPNTEKTVGTGDYVVNQGECISSIAYEHGHLVETILNDPANQALKEARKNYHVILPGDCLTIAPVRVKEVSAETDKNHKFQLQAPAEIFQVRLLDLDDKPRANLKYTLIIDQQTFSGRTDGQGQLKHAIPPNARHGRLTLISGKNREEIELRLGDLDPTNAVSGAQARLSNLGYDCGPVDGILGPQTEQAIKRFQKHNKLQQTGELDDASMQELETMHGS